MDAPALRPDTTFLARRETRSEQLAASRLVFELDLADNRGREAHVRLDLSHLAYQATYGRTGVVAAAAGDPGAAGRGHAARQLGLVAAHEEGRLRYEETRFELEVEGDTGLLDDYFSSSATAQRILDFAQGLVQRGVAGGGDRDGLLAAVADGVREGIGQARDLLGGMLPPVAEETASLVEQALEELANGDPMRRLLIDSLVARDDADR